MSPGHGALREFFRTARHARFVPEKAVCSTHFFFAALVRAMGLFSAMGLRHTEIGNRVVSTTRQGRVGKKCGVSPCRLHLRRRPASVDPLPAPLDSRILLTLKYVRSYVRQPPQICLYDLLLILLLLLFLLLLLLLLLLQGGVSTRGPPRP